MGPALAVIGRLGHLPPAVQAMSARTTTIRDFTGAGNAGVEVTGTSVVENNTFANNEAGNGTKWYRHLICLRVQV